MDKYTNNINWYSENCRKWIYKMTGEHRRGEGEVVSGYSMGRFPEVKFQAQRKRGVFKAKSTVSKEPPTRKRQEHIRGILQSLILE